MTLKGLLKTILGLVIIGAAVAIGWAVATATNPYASGNVTATPVAAQANNQGAARPTPIPTFTPATNTGTGANPTPGAGGTNAGGNAGAVASGQGGQRTAPITGTITTYDTSSKVVTLKDASGKDQQFDASNARVSKTQKLASADFSSAVGSNGIVLLSGTKNSDGTYAATSLVAIDPTAFGGGAGTAGGGFGGGRGAANSTPGAGGNGAAAGGTPGAAGGTGAGRSNGGGFAGGGFGGAGGGGVIVRGGTLQGNTFTGTDATGAAITASISDSTLLEKQVAGTTDDLKAGANASVVSRAATTGTAPQAITITLS